MVQTLLSFVHWSEGGGGEAILIPSLFPASSIQGKPGDSVTYIHTCMIDDCIRNLCDSELLFCHNLVKRIFTVD